VNPSLKRAIVTVIAGSALLIPAGIGLKDSGPTVLHPLPGFTVWPAFALASVHAWKAAVTLPTLFFFLWLPRLFCGDGKIPKRSYVLLAVAIALSALWFAEGWRYGLDYQGAKYTYIVCFINLAIISFLAVAFFRAWKMEPSFKTSLVLHWILFAWFAWYAFPWLGELP